MFLGINNRLKVICLISMCILNLLYMHNYIVFTCHSTNLLDCISWIDNFCWICFDVWMVLTICLIIGKGRIKAGIFISFCVTLIWAFCNVVYSRFFYHYLSLSSVLETSAIMDPLVLNSVIYGLRWMDVFFLIMPILFILVYKKTVNKGSAKGYIRLSFFIGCLLLLFDLFSHAVYCSISPSLRYWNYYERRVSMRIFGDNHLLALPNYANFQNGSLKSLAIEVFGELHGSMVLSEKQRNTINAELVKSQNSLNRDGGVQVDNVIFILVESYMSFVTDMIVDGREITPNLNSLKKDSSVYYNGCIHSNITMGESSDGQYILMTGLLPLRSIITVSKAHKMPLPSLVKSLRSVGIKQSRMILPTSSSLWRQDDMCRQYGFTHLFANNDYQGSHDETLTDEQVFELAMEKDRLMSNERFFSIILTATMHQPYNKIADPSFVIVDKSLSPEMKSYLNLCHYTDECIGTYLESLKKSGLYDNSLIVITADHHAHNTDFGKDVSNDIPLFIINGNLKKDAYYGKCNQVDIYTTLVDILGIKGVWPGLGFSLLNPFYKNSVTPIKWDVSEQVLLSGYFGDGGVKN